MKKTVLITGSNGLLGQKLTDIYSKLDVDFIPTARGACRHPLVNELKYEELDITNREQVAEVITKHRPDCVIHGAAMTNVDACEQDQAACDSLNVEGTKNIVDFGEEVGSHILFVSTDFIFDGENGPYSEDDKANPVSYYGNSKLIGEEYVKANASKWSIARTILVYGLVNDMSRSNIVLWAKNALSQNQAINVVDDQFRSPTLAEDLAIGCRLIEDQRAEGVFNISGKDFMSVYELVERVAKYYGLSMDTVTRISSASLNQPAKRPPKTGFDLSKSRNVLGYEPRSFEEGIKLLEEQLK